MMEKVAIAKVCLLPDKRLAVFPVQVSSSYQYVYREACEVYWDNEGGFFFSPVPRQWDYKRWYGQIVSVVLSSFGIRLSQRADTAFVPDDPVFVSDMRSAEDDVQHWIDVERPKIMEAEQSRGELQSGRRGRLPL